jgi:hypothetical protein
MARVAQPNLVDQTAEMGEAADQCFWTSRVRHDLTNTPLEVINYFPRAKPLLLAIMRDL